jgi:hypothetical protein
MPIACDTSFAPGVVQITFHGEWPNAKTLVAFRRGLIADGHLTNKSSVLFDMRPATTLPFQESVHTAIRAALDDSVQPRRRAYVVASMVQYGVARQLAAQAPADVATAVFWEPTKAMEWLTAG